MKFPKLEQIFKHYREYDHQSDALKFLDGLIEKHISEADLDRFIQLWRKAPGTAVNPFQKGIDLIKRFEGCHLTAYPDPFSGEKPYTIGWGSTRDFDGRPFQRGQKISQEDADALLRYQVSTEYLPVLQRTIPNWGRLNDNQKSALLSFAWNLGAYFMNSKNFETISRVLREGKYHEMRKALLLYRNPSSNVEEGLRRRRLAEADLWDA